MIDLSKVRHYYIACGYTDLRRGIDGLAAISAMPYLGKNPTPEELDRLMPWSTDILQSCQNK